MILGIEEIEAIRLKVMIIRLEEAAVAVIKNN